MVQGNPNGQVPLSPSPTYGSARARRWAASGERTSSGKAEQSSNSYEVASTFGSGQPDVTLHIPSEADPGLWAALLCERPLELARSAPTGAD
jgi:hypothetical protein